MFRAKKGICGYRLAVVSARVLRDFLSEDALDAVSNIEDPEMQIKVLRALELCADGLTGVDEAEPPEPELRPVAETIDLQVTVIEHMLDRVENVQKEISAMFPPPVDVGAHGMNTADIEFAFDLMESTDVYADTIDMQVDRSIFDGGVEHFVAQIEESVFGLASMLSEDIKHFRKHLESMGTRGEPWALYTEFHRFKGRCSQCLETTVASLMNAFGDGAIKQMFPRFTNDTATGIRLRREIVELYRDVSRLNMALKEAEDQRLIALHAALVERMMAFEESPSYEHVRPADRREVLNFLHFLDGWRASGGSREKLRTEVEGFSRYLEIMRGINGREELKRSDALILETVRQKLAVSSEAEKAFETLEAVYGRSDKLDVLIRRARRGLVDLEALHPVLDEVQGMLRFELGTSS